jgi:hypothetical protein
MSKKLFLALAVVLAAGCNKYGPEQQPAPAPNMATESASNKLPENVAASFALPQQVAYTMRCDLNSVGGVGLNPGVAGTIARSSQIVFNGWVVDERLAAPGSFVIVLKGPSTFGIATHTEAERPDVAQAVGSQQALHSGFGFVADISAVSPGRYAVYLYVPAIGAGCDTTKLLDITES